eukprot:GHVQ01029986.1.p1 GENE.GHVQ01029986.1~~GHVQ01029986.1.p1  ORF type:complete len:691 (+),score=69.82 GHVQ01029986.1:435-2507(+)
MLVTLSLRKTSAHSCMSYSWSSTLLCLLFLYDSMIPHSATSWYCQSNNHTKAILRPLRQLLEHPVPRCDSRIYNLTLSKPPVFSGRGSFIRPTVTDVLVSRVCSFRRRHCASRPFPVRLSEYLSHARLPFEPLRASQYSLSGHRRHSVSSTDSAFHCQLHSLVRGSLTYGSSSPSKLASSVSGSQQPGKDGSPLGQSSRSIPRPQHIPAVVWDNLESGIHRNPLHPLGIVKLHIEKYFTGEPIAPISVSTAANTGSPELAETFPNSLLSSPSVLSEPQGHAHWNLLNRVPSQSPIKRRSQLSYSEPSLPSHTPITPPTQQGGCSLQLSHTPITPPTQQGGCSLQLSRPQWEALDNFLPVVSSQQNFDDLLIDPDHISRKPSETFYLDKTETKNILRTQATAHQTELLRLGHRAVVWSAEVARRDQVDAIHFPIFHQMDGLRVFNESEVNSLRKILDIGGEALFAGERAASRSSDNPYADNVVVRHMQRSIEGLADYLFGETTERRWNYEETFPFTDNSMELEVKFGGKWMELLGCGTIKDEIFRRCNLSGNVGWAFGIGLERMAMLHFDIEDIRFFWSQDQRFHRQFANGRLDCKFVPFSKTPPVYKDVSFWMPEKGFFENDFFEACREVGGNRLEAVDLIDKYEKETRRSLCYRLTYRGLDENLTHEEINILQERLLKYCREILRLDVR